MSNKPRVLFTDDDLSTLELYRLAFSIANFESDFAVSGEQALKKYRLAIESEKPFRLLVFDAMMPGMNGFQVAERIRQTDKETSIAFLTGDTMPMNELRAGMIGADAVWQKCIVPEHTRLLIERHLAK